MRIVQLLKAPESKILEFKRDLSSPQNLLKTLVAFANTADSRTIIGGLSYGCYSPDETRGVGKKDMKR
ncbi:MAG: hypothetical protein DRH50_16615 [Deltaproteobacteria bacterium]|nr:MAG: hypothetical protein DRH50_16615 [Deltaproteobacteria bacterium]